LLGVVPCFVSETGDSLTSVLGGKRLTFTWVGDPNWFTGWGP
jgi:hypothetical protein